MFALVVVLPTPPLPDVMTMTLDTWTSIFVWRLRDKAHKSGDSAFAVLEVDLSRAPAARLGDVVGGQVGARDGDQLRLEPLAEDARAQQALHAGDGAAAQRGSRCGCGRRRSPARPG